MAAKNDNMYGLPNQQTNPGGPRGHQAGEMAPEIQTSPGEQAAPQAAPQANAGLPPVNQAGGAYAQPMQFGEDSAVTPPPMFEAPVVQERAVMGPQIDYSQYGPYTQQMTDEQLTSRQLEGLLASDSPYMRQAVLSGQRTAAERGALSSSISAGASQSAAIQAAAPIAAQDAQAYQRIASENATAINNNNLAKLESATRMATSKLQSLTALASTAMDAESRGKIAALNANAQSKISQMEIQARQEAQEFEAAHQRAMEMLGQQGRMDLAEFQQAGALELEGLRQAGALELEGVRQAGAMERTEREIQGRMDLAEAQNEYALEQIDHEGDIESYLTAQQIEGQIIASNNTAIAEIIANIGMSDMDPVQQARAMDNAIATFYSFTQDPPGPGVGGGAGAGGGAPGGRGPGGPAQP